MPGRSSSTANGVSSASPGTDAQRRQPVEPCVPPAAGLPFHRRGIQSRETASVYRGDRGMALQHVAALVGDSAYRDLWPQIGAWLSDVLDAAPAR
jgi:hypothetical protein